MNPGETAVTPLVRLAADPAGKAAQADPGVVAARAATLDERLAEIAARHRHLRFASSLAAEDMVLTHAIFSRRLPITVFTLDTGRLHAETIGMLDTIAERYGRRVEVYRPSAEAVDDFVARHGLNAFYESVEMRKLCCAIRKVEPLERALAGADGWLTGQRREQSVTRTELALAERDVQRGIAKYNPLFDWSEPEVWAYLQREEVPVNPLHARGYPSIGCEPCTRAVRAGEDSRAGRWWWESRDTKECGLHVSAT